MKPLQAVVTAVAVLATAPQARPQQAVPLAALRQAAQPLGAEPIEVLDLERAWAGAEPLLQLAVPVDGDPNIRNAAVRALGRLEDPRIIPQLLALGGRIDNGARAAAIAQSLHGFDPSVDAALLRTATRWMFDAGSPAIASEQTLASAAAVAGPLSRIAYADAAQVHDVEHILLKIATFTATDRRLSGHYANAAQAFESLARINQKVTSLEEETADRLKKMVRRTSNNDSASVRFAAFQALNAGRSLDAETETIALKDEDWQVRRVAATVLAGAGAGLDEAARLDLIDGLLADREAHVRYDALRAYVRHGARVRGCGPIEGMLSDRDLHVVLAAIDALGDLCKEDADLTDRLAADAHVPPAVGSWHRETHAFAALAKRSPEKAAPAMEAFVTHPVWWVRLYAAGAAAATKDLPHLEKLVFDANDNVRDAALGAWRRLQKAEADPAIVDALTRTDVQLLRTAAVLSKDSPRSDRIYHALLGALLRLTKEGKETSRDARLALLDAVAIHAAASDANDLAPLLKDFDPKVAEKAAQVTIALSGSVALREPVPLRRGWPQAFKDLRQCVSVQMASGGAFRIQMDPALAPIAVDRFLRLATTDKYYNGLSIHRVVPNFVIQGGSPGANEYSGAKEYMRDEITGRNSRGTVGLSTRGRNTADAQFFINLVDNPRLDFDYTIFARVLDMDVVDKIQEGDVMTAMNLTTCRQ